MKQNDDHWQMSLELIKKDVLADVIFDTWFSSLQFYEIINDDFYLIAPELFHVKTIKNRYLAIITNAVQKVTKVNYNIIVVTEETLQEEINLSINKAEYENNVANNSQKKLNELQKTLPKPLLGSLNPSYTFDTFVIGNSNRMAHATSYAVAEAPATTYNPLFLHGDVGLGKTHLMHSIAHFILNKNKDSRVIYVSSETFTNELINAIKDDKNEEFRNKYRNIDVLLIDDIQFISQKERTQEEFFHTFNTLYESGKQIIISSDRKPKEIKTLEDRLRSRFECGLIVDINPPDYETRIAILRKKADSENLHVPDDVTEFIAKSIVSNIRELEGALTRVIAYSKLAFQEINLELAKACLKDVFREKAVVSVSIDLIKNIVATYYNITIEDINSKKKPKSIAFPRQIAMYLSRKLMDLSLPKIGENFGGRDHTTVIHACNKIEDIIEKDNQIKEIVASLEKQIKGE